MASLSIAEQDVLLSVNELSPLWEIAGSFSQRTGEPDVNLVRAKVSSILRDFAARGWLELRRERIVGSDSVGEPLSVPIHELDRVLADERNWYVPRDRTEPEFDHFTFDTTPAAVERIRAGALNDVWPR